ncbi:MAG TPA: hypothetical protein VG817_00515 [Gemmatimonadales bacterium]|nr:hypothetical protein [Gemmatimonadales bacterium]
MNTGLAQLVALTAHGNIALHAANHRSGLEQSNLFQYVGQLSFGMTDTPQPADPETATGWFNALRARGIQRLHLIRLPAEPEGTLRSYDRSAFANGEQAAIAAVDPRGRMELWVPQWHSVERGRQQTWVLRYRGSPAGTWSEALRGKGVQEVTSALRETLREIAAFAAANELEHWAEHFDRAASLLDPSARQYNADMLPEAGYTAEARRLLTTAMSGWGFGGMGSWNDTGPVNSDDYPRYQALTQQLYDAIMDALIAAANDFQDHL